MGNRSLSESLSFVQALAPSTLTTNNTTVAGTATDVAGFDSTTVIISVGACGDTTTGGWEIGLQHSDDTVSGNFVDVPDAELSHYVTGDNTTTGAQDTGIVAKIDAVADGSQIYTADYLGSKRYIRYKISAEGNQSNGTPFAISYAKGRPGFAKTGANRSA